MYSQQVVLKSSLEHCAGRGVGPFGALLSKNKNFMLTLAWKNCCFSSPAKKSLTTT